MLYFTEQDYQIFTAANAAVKNPDMKQQREKLQNKMLRLHKMIYPRVQLLGLACHENTKHITSLITPDKHTGQFHTWLLVRYGKTPKEISPYKEFDMGFTKHACLQFGLSEDAGFSMHLFLGRRDGWDRQKVQEKKYRFIVQNRDRITAELEKLKGYGMCWEITGQEAFALDEQDAAAFCDWFIEHDGKGEESFLRISYDMNDARISTDQIHLEILRKLHLLLPLYNLLTQRK